MTRQEFTDFIASAKARGFQYVETMAGPLSLDEWFPYGAFTTNPGIEKHIEGFFWISDTAAVDANPDTHNGPFPAGVWTFRASA